MLTPTGTPIPTATPAPTSTPTVAPTGPGLALPPTPVCPERSSTSTFTNLLGIVFYVGVAGIAFALSQVVARKAAQWAYQRKLRNEGGSRR
jgi:hypothetical protein